MAAASRLTSIAKRRIAIGGVALLLLIAGGYAWLRPESEPLFQDRTLSAWALDYYINPTQRDTAAEVIRAAGTNALPGLTEMLKAQDSFFRARLWSLASRSPRGWRRIIVGGTKVPDAIVRRGAAAQALGLLGESAAPAAPALLVMMTTDISPENRWTASSALVRIGPAAIPSLVQGLKHSDPYARQPAAFGLGQLGLAATSAVPVMIASLDETNAAVRDAVIAGLKATGRTSMPALLVSLETGSDRVRQGAAEVIAGMNPTRRRAAAPLLKLAVDPAPGARRAAYIGLGSIVDVDEPIIKVLRDGLKDTHPEVRLAAANAIQSQGPRAEAAIPELTLALRDSSLYVRASAVKALGRMGAAARPALTELEKLSADPSPEVRKSLLETKRLIGESTPQ